MLHVPGSFVFLHLRPAPLVSFALSHLLPSLPSTYTSTLGFPSQPQPAPTSCPRTITTAAAAATVATSNSSIRADMGDSQTIPSRSVIIISTLRTTPCDAMLTCLPRTHRTPRTPNKAATAVARPMAATRARPSKTTARRRPHNSTATAARPSPATVRHTVSSSSIPPSSRTTPAPTGSTATRRTADTSSSSSSMGRTELRSSSSSTDSSKVAITTNSRVATARRSLRMLERPVLKATAACLVGWRAPVSPVWRRIRRVAPGFWVRPLPRSREALAAASWRTGARRSKFHHLD